MNSLLIFKEELQGTTAVVTGTHLAYIRTMHDLEKDRTIPVLLWNERQGHGVVTASTPDCLSLSVTLTELPQPRDPTTLIVAIPRPQTQKKIIHLAVVLGVSELHFIRTGNTEKSYLDSKVLEPESLKYEIVKGLEQACDAKPPEIFIHPRFKPFVEDVLSPKITKLTDPLLVLGDTTQGAGLGPLASPQTPAIVAVGPELGWNDFERQSFKERGFSAISLGKRILRSDTATAVLLSQIGLLRNRHSPGSEI